MKYCFLLIPLAISCGTPSSIEIRTVLGQETEMARLTMVNHQRNGKALIQNSTATITKTGVYKNGKKEGRWTEKHQGIVVRTLNYSKGRFHGEVTNYWPDGMKAETIDFVNGTRQGKEERFYKNGKIRESIDLQDGKRHGKFERWIWNDTLQNGTYLLGQFCAGQNCGIWTKFYSKKKKYWQVKMENGLRIGEMKRWDRDGKLTAVWRYKNGKVVEKRIIE